MDRWIQEGVKPFCNASFFFLLLRWWQITAVCVSRLFDRPRCVMGYDKAWDFVLLVLSRADSCCHAGSMWCIDKWETWHIWLDVSSYNRINTFHCSFLFYTGLLADHLLKGAEHQGDRIDKVPSSKFLYSNYSKCQTLTWKMYLTIFVTNRICRFWSSRD